MSGVWILKQQADCCQRSWLGQVEFHEGLAARPGSAGQKVPPRLCPGGCLVRRVVCVGVCLLLV